MDQLNKAEQDNDLLKRAFKKKFDKTQYTPLCLDLLLEMWVQKQTKRGQKQSGQPKSDEDKTTYATYQAILSSAGQESD